MSFRGRREPGISRFRVWSFGPSRNDKPSPRKLHEMTYTPAPRDPKQTPVRINLLSDTQTRPTPAMREAIARAEVGDEQLGDDPTVNVLCERVADLLGKEAAVFMPSGTMCNVAATLTHCRPGDEILAHETAHIIAREGGAHAALGGFQITPLPGADGQFSPETFRAALHPRSRDFIDEVWRWKQRLGGSMRQAGICAAACTYALDHHVDRLADDHANARALARGLSQIAGIEVQQPETNLVFFKPDGAGVTGDDMVKALRQRGVLLAMMDGRIRACTHLDVSAAMIEETVGLVRDIARGAE